MPSQPALPPTKACALLIPLLAASGCGGGQAPLDGCAGWSPIRPTGEDIETISDQLVEQILSHNESGAARGCWKPNAYSTGK